MSRKRPLVALCLLASACADSSGSDLVAQLKDPTTCRQCHAEHYRQWSGSMHAYAAEDPVFLAMNARGQEETEGELGTFCVNCHAPVAVRDGLTTDGLNLAELSPAEKGVSCYFCHNVASVDGSHNNPIRLANDSVMRGGIRDPRGATLHGSQYSPQVDSLRAESADVCGSCHDIVTPSPPAPASVELERTFAEWKTSVFSPDVQATVMITCAACHMSLDEGPAAIVDGQAGPTRTLHSHEFPGVDTALTDFPETERQHELVQEFLDGTIRLDVCLSQLADSFRVRVILDNVGAGHSFPSGAAQDRRAWIELRAFEGSREVYSSGVVADGEAVATLDDPDLWLLRDTLFGPEGDEVHMFWQGARIESNVVPGGPAFNTFASRRFPVEEAGSASIPGRPDRVTVRLRMRSIGIDVLDDLVESGHLVPGVIDELPTFDLKPDRTTDATFEYGPRTLDQSRFERFQIQSETPGDPPYECIGVPRGER